LGTARQKSGEGEESLNEKPARVEIWIEDLVGLTFMHRPLIIVQEHTIGTQPDRPDPPVDCMGAALMIKTFYLTISAQDGHWSEVELK
jgi:hypothetical protein